LEAIVTALQKLLRQAEGATRPADADEEIVDSLKALSDDTEEVSAFLHNLVDIDKQRAAQYLVQCRTFLPELFGSLKQAMEPMPPEMGADDEEDEPFDDDEDQGLPPDLGDENEEEEGGMPPEMGGDEPMPPEMGGEEEPEMPGEEEPEIPGEEEPEMGADEPMPPEMGADDDAAEDSAMPPEMGGDEDPEDEEPGEDEVAVEPVVDQDELDSEEANADDLDMVLFQSAASKGPHWSVFYRGRPLCAIRLADQDNAEEIAEIFTSEEYPQHVKDACASPIGIRETLASLNAHWYMGVISTGTVAAEARESAARELEDEFAGRLASLKEDLLNTVNLAIVASNKGAKGLFVENKLKAACVQVLRDAGVANPAGALNEVWAEAAQDYMQDILKVAEKWLGYSAEAMQEVTAEIVGTEVEVDLPEVEDETPAAIQAAARRQASTGITSVPIRTRQPFVHGSEDDYKQVQNQRVASTLSRRMGRSRLG